MSQKFDKSRHSRSTVTVKFTTSQESGAIADDVERNGLCIDTYAIESVTIREVSTVTLTPEQYAKRRQAAQAAREAAALVWAGPDPRD